jgi:recombination protein RecT
MSSVPVVVPAKQKAVAALTNERVMAALKTVATKHLTAERIVRLVIGEFSRNPKLAECDPNSIVLCALAFSQLGLEPGSLLGQAYMIPRKNKKTQRLEANFQLGYKGKIALNYRSGMFEFIYADVVYRDDKFEYEYGSQALLRHIPNQDSERRADEDVVATYAIARLKGSSQALFRVLTRKEISQFRARSQSPNDGPWVTDFAAMARKTAVHRLETFLPMSTEVATAHAFEEKSESGELSFADFAEIEIIQNGNADDAGGVDGLKARLGVKGSATIQSTQ